MTGSGLLTAGDRLAAGRHRSLAATVEWSYRLLGEEEQRVFRAGVGVPGAVHPGGCRGGRRAGRPPRQCCAWWNARCWSRRGPGPDGRSRYGMLETLRAYGAGLLAEAGEDDGAPAALAGWAVRVAEEAAAGMQTIEGRLAAARWLDAEDATMGQVLAWAVEHDLRCGGAAGGRAGLVVGAARPAGGPVPAAAPGRRAGRAGQRRVVRRAVLACDGAVCRPICRRRCGIPPRSATWSRTGGHAGRWRTAWTAGRGTWRTSAGSPRRPASRRALAMARQIGYPAGEARALVRLGHAALNAGDLDEAVQLARQAAQITAGVPGAVARLCSYSLAGVLIVAGDLAAAEQVCAAALARAREAGDMLNHGDLLKMMATWTCRRAGSGTPARTCGNRLQFTRTGTWFSLFDDLDGCGHLCAATGRPADALTVWAAWDAFVRSGGFRT